MRDVSSVSQETGGFRKETMNTPEEIKSHERDYKPDAWKSYSIEELGCFVHLLAKRSEHRSDFTKKAKDLEDARNYWRMIGSHLDELESK